MATYIVIRRVTLYVIAFVAMHTSLHAQKRWEAPRIISTNCSGCHGIDGNAELPYFSRLAGLDAAYMKKKVGEFNESPPPAVDEMYQRLVNAIEGKKSTDNITPDERTNMIGIAHGVKPAVMKQAVQWYMKQCPAPGRGRNNALLQQGKAIFDKGVPDQQILPCMSCHGHDAQGQGMAPRLAGQNAEYVQSQMDNFRRGDRKHAPEMTMVAREINQEQTQAVAAYVQSK